MLPFVPCSVQALALAVALGRLLSRPPGILHVASTAGVKTLPVLVPSYPVAHRAFIAANESTLRDPVTEERS